MYAAIAAILGYLLGSIPFGFMFARVKGIDLREQGSGATGGTNVSRTLGMGYGVLTAVLDLLKGAAAAYLGQRLAGTTGVACAGFAVMLGHCYPVWLGFKGGKGVATGGGAFFVLYPLWVVIALAGMALTILPTRYVSLGSLVAALIACGGAAYMGPLPIKLWALGAFLLVAWRHRSNISRLLSGTERKLGQKVNTKEGAQ